MKAEFGSAHLQPRRSVSFVIQAEAPHWEWVASNQCFLSMLAFWGGTVL